MAVSACPSDAIFCRQTCTDEPRRNVTQGIAYACNEKRFIVRTCVTQVQNHKQMWASVAHAGRKGQLAGT